MRIGIEASNMLATHLTGIEYSLTELVRRFKGSYSGEHGDGISRSEFVAPLFGPVLASAFETVKDAFDPDWLLNPAKVFPLDESRRFREGAATWT